MKIIHTKISHKEARQALFDLKVKAMGSFFDADSYQKLKVYILQQSYKDSIDLTIQKCPCPNNSSCYCPDH